MEGLAYEEYILCLKPPRSILSSESLSRFRILGKVYSKSRRAVLLSMSPTAHLHSGCHLAPSFRDGHITSSRPKNSLHRSLLRARHSRVDIRMIQDRPD